MPHKEVEAAPSADFLDRFDIEGAAFEEDAVASRHIISIPDAECRRGRVSVTECGDSFTGRAFDKLRSNGRECGRADRYAASSGDGFLFALQQDGACGWSLPDFMLATCSSRMSASHVIIECPQRWVAKVARALNVEANKSIDCQWSPGIACQTAPDKVFTASRPVPFVQTCKSANTRT